MTNNEVKMKALTQTNIPGAKKLFSGKVRDVYELDDEHLLIVSTDRISAFDHIFPNGIPGKGEILNTISNLWFKNIGFIRNHIVETDHKKFPKPFCDHDELKDRAVITRRAKKIDFECIARGYIIGTGWNDYKKTGAICGITLPTGLKLADRLEKPIFTPSTKADEGHDENIAFEHMQKELGKELSGKISEMTLKVFSFAGEVLDKCNIIIADTKLEFGIVKDELILIDEVLTPDSSRFWEKEKYTPGISPLSFDKQYIRDYLNTTTWDKNSPAPALPEEVVEKTREKYLEILNRITTVLN